MKKRSLDHNAASIERVQVDELSLQVEAKDRRFSVVSRILKI